MNALVLGGADCVWDDLAALEGMVGRWIDAVVVVNDVGVHWPRRMEAWATLHPEKLQPWMEARKENGYPGGFAVWAHEKQRWHSSAGREFVDRTLPVPYKTGSSGLFAIDVARALGCERIVLCGVPMTVSPHFTRGEPWTDADRFWPPWLERRDLADVRSMSGRTRDLLGAPSPSWLMEAAKC